MRKGLFLALILTLTLVASAAAAPRMLEKGHKSLSFQADTERPTIAFGWNVADMTKVQVGGGFANVDTGVEGADSQTTWNLDVGFARYLSGATTQMFAPFIGGTFFVQETGDEFHGGSVVERDPSIGFRGFFGVEAFVVESLSLGGNVGIQFTRQGDAQDGDTTLNGEKSTTTSSSAITATIYW